MNCIAYLFTLDLSLPRKSAVRLTDRLGIAIDVDYDVKLQNKQTNICPTCMCLNDSAQKQ